MSMILKGSKSFEALKALFMQEIPTQVPSTSSPRDRVRLPVQVYRYDQRNTVKRILISQLHKESQIIWHFLYLQEVMTMMENGPIL